MQDKAAKSIQLSNVRAILLGVTSLIMSLSIFMSAFAPYPLALVSSILGRKRGYGLCLVLLVISLVLSIVVFKSVFTFGIFCIVILVSIMTTEIIRLKIKPVKGIFISGLVLLFLSLTVGYAGLKSQDLSLKGYILQTIEENKEAFEQQKRELEKSAKTDEAFQSLSLLNQPEILADTIIKEIPTYFVGGAFLVIWLNLFLLIRSQRFLLRNRSSALSEFSLIYIKLPDHLIWIVIASLGMVLAGDQLSPLLPQIGSVIISALAVFYFFQGFGIYIHFLNYVNVKGIFRTLLIVFTILTANYILVLIGLFDMFINFRRFFIKK